MNSFNSAITAMRRSPYQTLVAILMSTITCFVAYTFSLVAIGANQILRYFETRPQIIAFFELEASNVQIQTAESTLRNKPYVSDVKVVSKDQALEIYREDNQDDPLLLELVTADILPASIEVSGQSAEDLGQIKTDLEAVSGIDEVVYQQDVINSLNTWTNALRWVGIVSSAVLGVLSFLIVMVIIGMKVTAKRQAIAVMRMIGATKWFIKRPFMLEGLLYGLVGSLLGWAITFGGLLYLTPSLREFLGSITILPIRPEIFAIQVVVGTIIAMLIGSMAAHTAAQRQMKH